MASSDESDDAIQRDLLAALEQYGDSLLSKTSESPNKSKKHKKKQNVEKVKNELGTKNSSKKSIITEKIAHLREIEMPKQSKLDIKAIQQKISEAKTMQTGGNRLPINKKSDSCKITGNMINEKVKGKRKVQKDNSDSESEYDSNGFESDNNLAEEDFDSDSENDLAEEDFDSDSENDLAEEDFDSDSENDLGSSDDEPQLLTGKQKQLLKMKEALGLTDEDFLKKQKAAVEKGRSIEKAVCKADLRPVQRKRPPPEVIVFEQLSKKKKQLQVPPASLTKASVVQPKRSEDSGPIFDIKEARHQVQQFGITGLEGKDKQDAVTALLVRLGAKPPKKDYLNYKQLQEKKKQQQAEQLKQREWDRSMGFKVSSSAKRYSANRASQKRDRNDVGIVDGQVGSYRGGVQRLTKEDVTAITRKSKKGKRRK